MYSVDQNDQVMELGDLPSCSVGAPLPLVICDDYRLVLSYLIRQPPTPGWDGRSVRIVDPRTAEDTAAIVEFVLYHAVLMGPPNDEAFHGHPLASRGLHPYGAFKINHSSWIRLLERMNSVHPNHNPNDFEQLNHFVFAFHDTTFECVARDYKVSLHIGPRNVLLAEMMRLLDK